MSAREGTGKEDKMKEAATRATTDADKTIRQLLSDNERDQNACLWFKQEVSKAIPLRGISATVAAEMGEAIDRMLDGMNAEREVLLWNSGAKADRMPAATERFAPDIETRYRSLLETDSRENADADRARWSAMTEAK